MANYIRFDWAMKRLLCDKANYAVLEGFLSTLLNDDIHIYRVLESEFNQRDAIDKFNRVDMLVEDSHKRLLIIEVQNTRELDYFHRMLYGTSQAITEYIKLGEEYENILKVYSINIVYFHLGQGKDYIYHGKTHFYGLHEKDDELQLSRRQKATFEGRFAAGDIFPEYYVLRVNEFDQIARTHLDEWVRFLKTGEIKETDTAKGLPEAREKLRVDSLPEKERKAYYRDMENVSYQRSVIKTGWIEGREEGKAEGLAERKAEGEKEATLKVAANLKSKGMDTAFIAEVTGLAAEEIEKL